MKSAHELRRHRPYRLRGIDVSVSIACLLSVFILSACPSDIATGELETDLSFSVSGAKAIAGYSAKQARASMAGGAAGFSRDAGTESAALVKVMEDGTVEAAINIQDGYGSIPDIAFISVGDDNSVYICFEFPHTYWSRDGTTTSMQLIRVYPDNRFDVLWPLDPTDYNYSEDGTINTWTWWGMDSDPLQKGDDGKIYFKVEKSINSMPINFVYSYDPDSGDKPVLRTPSNAMLNIESFKVDSAEHLFIKGTSSNNGGGYLRYYSPNVIAPQNIYYSSNGNTWARGYSPTPAGDALIINSYNINGLSGIIRANISGTDIQFESLYQNDDSQYEGIYFDYVGEMIWAPDGSLYGLYDGYWWGGSDPGTKVLKLLSPSGDTDFKVISFNHGNAIPSKIKYIDGYIYYRYAVMNGEYETGYHKLARLNLATQEEEEVLVDAFLASRDLEILSYDASTDNSILYFSALDYQANSVIVGKINLVTKAFSEIPASTIYNMVRTF